MDQGRRFSQNFSRFRHFSRGFLVVLFLMRLGIGAVSGASSEVSCHLPKSDVTTIARRNQHQAIYFEETQDLIETDSFEDDGDGFEEAWLKKNDFDFGPPKGVEQVLYKVTLDASPIYRSSDFLLLSVLHSLNSPPSLCLFS